MILRRDDVHKTAEKLVAKGKIEAAIKEYRKVLAKNPNDINILNRVGDLYARVQRNEDAVKAYTQIADQYANDGFYVKAIAVYKKIQRIDTGTGVAIHRQLAELYHKQGLANDARHHYQALADYYQQRNDTSSAMAMVEKMVELDPNDPSHHAKLAELYQREGLLAKAVEEHGIIAELMLASGHVDEAVQVYRRALNVDASNMDFVRGGVEALKEAGHGDAARNLIAAASQVNPGAMELLSLVDAAQPEVDAFAVPEESSPVLPSSVDSADPFGDVGGEIPTESPSLEPEPLASPGLEPDEPADEVFGLGGSAEDHSLDSLKEAEGAGYEEFSLDLEDEGPPPTQVVPPSDLMDDASSGESGATESLSQSELSPLNPPASLNEQEIEVDWAFDPTPELAEGSVVADDAAPSLAVSGTQESGSYDSTPAGLDELAGVGAGNKLDQDLLERTAGEVEPTEVRREDDLLAEAEVFVKYGLTEKAMDRLQEVLEINPRHLGAYRYLVTLYLEMDSHEEVVPLAQKMSSLAHEQQDLEGWNEVHQLLEGAGYQLQGQQVLGPPSASGEGAPTEGHSEMDLDGLMDASGFGEVETAPSPASEDLDLFGDEPDDAAETELELSPLIPEDDPQATSGEGDFGQMDSLPLASPELEPTPLDDSLGSPAAEPAAADDPLSSLAEVDFSVEPETAPEIEVTASDSGWMAEIDVEDIGPGGEDSVPPSSPAFDLVAEPPVSGPEAHGSGLDVMELLEPMEPMAPMEPMEAMEPMEPMEPSSAQAASDTPVVPPQATPRDEAIHSVEEPAVAKSPAPAAVPTTSAAAMSWLEEESTPAGAPAKPDESLFDDEEALFDLASELEGELGEPSEAGAADEEEPKEKSLEEIVEGFKKGVRENLSPEDSDTHFNLGIAYREMGLVDEAIGEFQIAARDPGYLVDSGSMLGMCFDAKGMPQLAVKWYRKALDSPQISQTQTLAMLYDLGNTYLAMNDSESAYKTFIEIYGLDTTYRDVMGKLAELSARRGQSGEGPASQAPPSVS